MEVAMTLAAISLFLAAALAIAITPGPGIFYVASRTLSGGRREGLASSLGTAFGGLVHVVCGALGVSALVLARAALFTALKLLGAAYLVWLGVTTVRAARVDPAQDDAVATGAAAAFRQGVLVEALNPKTAAFFLAFIPQFIAPAQGDVALQFVVLGLVSVVLNTAVDVLVVLMAARARSGLTRRPNIIRRMRETSGVVMCALGASLALVRRTA